MPILTYDIRIDQFSDLASPVFAVTAAGAAINWNGATARMMIRVQPTDAVPLVSITTTPSASGGIVLGTISNVPGALQFTIKKAITGGLTITKAGYDLFVDWTDGTSTELLFGNVFVNPANTH